MRPEATSVCGLKLLVNETLSCLSLLGAQRHIYHAIYRKRLLNQQTCFERFKTFIQSTDLF
jgi:hypothetical protein